MGKLPSRLLYEVLKRYRIHTPLDDERYFTREHYDRGRRLRLEIRSSKLGSVVLLGTADIDVARVLPLDAHTLDALIADLARDAKITFTQSAIGQLRHLIVQACRIYETLHLNALRLDPLYVGDSDYRLMFAQAETARRVHIRKRLPPDAHDRRAVYAYRPTARLHAARRDRN